MASMVFASSPLSAQSFVKLRTNSNYPHSSCYVPSPYKAKNYYVHLSYKNISHIESSKSLFTKGDGNFSFSLPKIPRVPSTLSPSLNIIKACRGVQNIYHFKACDMRESKYIKLGDSYERMVLLIVNIPQQDSEWTKKEIEFLNGLRQRYQKKRPKFANGFEVLGFLHDKNELPEKSRYAGKDGEVSRYADFPIFGKVEVNADHESFFRGIFMHDTMQRSKDEDLWYFLRHTPIGGTKIEKINEGFEKILVNAEGVPIHHYPRFDNETLKPQPEQSGGNPGSRPGKDPFFTLQNDIDEYFFP